ncbi:MAG: DUF4388 domain-containing protein [Pseudomonadota bacterium]
MTEISSIPELMGDNVVAFDDAKDLGPVLAALYRNGTSWIFINGVEPLRMQESVKVFLGLRGVPRPVVEVECTPRYQSPGAMGCEVRISGSEAARAALDALLTVVAAVVPKEGAAGAGSSPDESNPFEGEDFTAPDVEFISFKGPDESTRKIGSEAVEVEEAFEDMEPVPQEEPEVGETGEAHAPPEALVETAPDRDALAYRVTSLHGVDQLLRPAGGIEAPKPMGTSGGEQEGRTCLLLALFEFLGMKHFTGIVTIEWKDAKPVPSTVVHIRKGDLIRSEDQGEGQPDAEEAFLLYLAKEKAVSHDEAEAVRRKHGETGKSIGNLLFEGGLLTLDRISESMRSHKEEAFFSLLYREGVGIARVRPKLKMKGHPIRVSLSRNCIIWVRKVLLEQYRRNLDQYLAQWMQSYPEVDQEATRYPLTWLLRVQKEMKTAETVLTGAILAQECYDMAPVSQHDLARLFVLLTRYGALEWRDLPKASEDNRALTPEQQLEQHLAYLRQSNPFTRLGVHWATHPVDIDLKSKIVMRKYAPDSRYARQSDRTRAICQEISDLLRASQERLMDRRTRIEERSRIVEESQGRFAAQFMEKQARIIKFRGERTLAIQTIEVAIEIFPNSSWIAMLKMWKSEAKR